MWTSEIHMYSELDDFFDSRDDYKGGKFQTRPGVI